VINHQYSKSSEFEKKFRDYLTNLTPSVSYFSLLRPLYELQIAKILAKLPQYHQVFKSCNVNQSLGHGVVSAPSVCFLLPAFIHFGEG